MSVVAIPFGSSGFGLPYAVFSSSRFTGWNNSSGTGGAGNLFGGISGTSNPGAPGTGGSNVTPFGQVQQGVTQSLLSAQQDALQSNINNSLATLSDQGAYYVSNLAGLFNGWAQNIGQVNTASAAALTAAVNKSANGCSGFLSCLFG